MGATVVIVGLYMLLWGKEGDLKVHIAAGEQSYPTYNKTKDSNIQKTASAAKDIQRGEP